MDSDIALAGAYEDRPGGSGAWPELMPGDVEEFGFDENPWAWADFPGKGETERVDIAGAHVTAVLVTLDAARWLPATLEALAKLDTRPTRLIAIDNASTDATRTLLDRAHDQGVLDAVYGGSREFGFGDWSSTLPTCRMMRTRSASVRCRHATRIGCGSCTTMPWSHPTRSISYWPT